MVFFEKMSSLLRMAADCAGRNIGSKLGCLRFVCAVRWDGDGLFW